MAKTRIKVLYHAGRRWLATERDEAAALIARERLAGTARKTVNGP